MIGERLKETKPSPEPKSVRLPFGWIVWTRRFTYWNLGPSSRPTTCGIGSVFGASSPLTSRGQWALVFELRKAEGRSNPLRTSGLHVEFRRTNPRAVFGEELR